VSSEHQALVDAAIAARGAAHAPYSGYRVGAAVRAGSGRTYTGCNVEISSYSHTCCAERVAVFKAISEGESTIEACAVVTDDAQPAAPCGACRQVLHDFGPDMVLILANLEGRQVSVPLADLLPMAFQPDHVLSHIRGEWSKD
jgi:cytidine deaminase